MRVLLPLPDADFDITEVAVPWKVLTRAGHEVVVATEAGRPPTGDPKLLEGVLFGRLGAEPEAKAWYRELLATDGFRQPASWAEVDVSAFDALLLPGGHAPGMRQYLASAVLQAQVARFWSLDRPVGAICHGVVLLSRATDEATGRSVLAGRRTTALARWQERSAYWLTAWRLGRYYRTYPTYVQDEITAALGPTGRFERGPLTTARGTDADDDPAFVVVDGRYVSARWPGDAYAFAKALLAQLDG